MSAKDKLAALRKAFSDGQRDLSAMREEIAQLEARKKYLRTAPLTLEDTRALLVTIIRDQQHTARLLGQDRLEDIRKQGIGLYSGENEADFELGPDGASDSWSPFWATDHRPTVINLLVLALGDPETIAERLDPIVARLDFTQAGPPIEARKKELVDIERRLTVLHTQVNELDLALKEAAQLAA